MEADWSNEFIEDCDPRQARLELYEVMIVSTMGRQVRINQPEWKYPDRFADSTQRRFWDLCKEMMEFIREDPETTLLWEGGYRWGEDWFDLIVAAEDIRFLSFVAAYFMAPDGGAAVWLLEHFEEHVLQPERDRYRRMYP